jgi:hypothetical protein
MLKEARGSLNDGARCRAVSGYLKPVKSALWMIACISAGRSSSGVEFLCVHEKLAILKLEYDDRSSNDLCFGEKSEREEIEVLLPFQFWAGECRRP